MQIAIDINNQAGNGESWLAGNADTQVNSQVNWEYLIQTRFASSFTGSPIPVNLYTHGEGFTNWTPVQTGLSYIDSTTDLVEISIPWSVIYPMDIPPMPLRFTVAVMRSQVNDDALDISGTSDVLDVLTNYGDPQATDIRNTWEEVSDATIDYYFELWFVPANIANIYDYYQAGEVYSPILISEFLSNPSTDEIISEWIEIFHVGSEPINSQSDQDSDNIGDVCDNCLIDDENDNCPLVANPDQTDSNNDGIGDACENDPDPQNNDDNR